MGLANWQYSKYIVSGWWFGCHQFFIFPEILGILSSQLTKSYFSGRGGPGPPTSSILNGSTWNSPDFIIPRGGRSCQSFSSAQPRQDRSPGSRRSHLGSPRSGNGGGWEHHLEMDGIGFSWIFQSGDCPTLYIYPSICAVTAPIRWYLSVLTYVFACCWRFARDVG